MSSGQTRKTASQKNLERESIKNAKGDERSDWGTKKKENTRFSCRKPSMHARYRTVPRNPREYGKETRGISTKGPLHKIMRVVRIRSRAIRAETYGARTSFSAYRRLQSYSLKWWRQKGREINSKLVKTGYA